ncbi:MAG: thioredoxin-disulfide reductase [Candidatus Riflebacteria bacterium]|nr:thioredoxin-disulfide reductase [Candidatus Riflebacteria bacterium]
MTHKVVIIGSGPAGLTAAIYAARAELQPLVIEGFMKGGMPGGQLMSTGEVENFPGFPEGVQGADLIQKLKQQAERFGATFLMEDVETADLTGSIKKLTTTSGENISANSVIIATGARAKLLNLPSVETFWGKGVSACAMCDGALPIFRNQPVAVIGGGDSALEEAGLLSKFASKVYLIHRRDEFRASKAMQKKVFDNPKIEVVYNSVLEEICGGDLVESIKLKNVKTNEVTEVPMKGVFMSIGHSPNADFAKGQLELDPAGYIKTAKPTTKTNLDGVFACGDVIDPNYRQAIVAAGTGCMAAMDAERWLSSQ